MYINCNTFSGFRTSSKDEPDTQTDSRTVYIHPADPRYNNGGRFAFWLHIHSVVLHSEFYLVISSVLHVWFPFSGFHHSGNNLRRNNCFVMLFPPLRRGLPLVVEVISYLWFYSCLFLSLLLSLLLHKTTD